MRAVLEPGQVACSIPVAPGFRAGISLAAAGDMGLSRSAANRARFLEALDIDVGQAYGLHQVHSRRLVRVDEQNPSQLAGLEADCMITSRCDAVLTVTVADCLPVFLVDRSRGVFGVAHSGWKGTGIAGDAVRQMGREFGSRPSDLLVTIGPGIGACCYRVPEDRASTFAREFGDETVVRGPDGSVRLDLRRANVLLLESQGVDRITVIEDCTCCTPSLGSFRREGSSSYTLMLAFLGWASRGS